MHSFEELSGLFATRFKQSHFPEQPATLYEPNNYFLQLGGKRVRPVLCVMGSELFGDINPEAWEVATAIELFHNFTLIHDDIMDKAPLRRGMQTVHTKYNESTAILAGDVMLVTAYDYINRIGTEHLPAVLGLFNRTAREVCEGQQMDMDFENRSEVTLEAYLHMIELKTSVLIAAALKMGAILSGAGERNLELIYSFGLKLGLAFQVQDDYLDAFGDPSKFGKQVGGDILANKKTFLLIHALEACNERQRLELDRWLAGNEPGKVEGVLKLFRECGVDAWALELKNKFLDEAWKHLDDIAVQSHRKEPLTKLAQFLVQRDY
ncbi:MAG: polyprenyl synthetase [Sphingobacteriales bacterium SCN 48-20]|uniref:polyprenyl synthetase family protein n=1 Tax=Terrimonas ferruginea TaxID=249 RepID=UPI000868FEF6|nr:polyprenyl synthetase family protein [Terrimonas ferruginea]MBN8782887.1 polyprenyl synthetase family protein [Terrimonas ferruginea]ODT92751.1 MAG: polyprenyl synthetase [Sphingobacteriales bacterium SCN 48-20]OJW44084.1 MAG: polyprenyl synthetase [Sphingobacteriales bacterium 48-107]